MTAMQDPSAYVTIELCGSLETWQSPIPTTTLFIAGLVVRAGAKE
jgi:hypothetical protein